MKSKAARKRQRIKRRSRKKTTLESRALTKDDVEKASKPKESTALPKANTQPAPKVVPNANTNPASEASAVWRGIYESLVFRQYEAQIEYWKARARQLEEENEELRRQLTYDIPPYDTSSEEEDEDDAQQRYLDGDSEEYDQEDLSPEYMEFRSVTLKHREELRKQRERERHENSLTETAAK